MDEVFGCCKHSYRIAQGIKRKCVVSYSFKG